MDILRTHPLVIVEHRLVAVGIERRAERGDPTDAMLRQRFEQRALGGHDAGQELAHGLVHDPLLRHACDRAAQIVCRREQIAGQA
jgi:hypothetical protein